MLGRGLGALVAILLLAPPLAQAQEPSRERGAPDSLPADRWVASDKAAHLFAGAWSAGAGYAVADRLGADRAGRRAGAVAAGLAAGIAKEAFDRYVQDEPFSWKDLAADAAGILLLVGVTAAAEP
jgi:uncharacterized protein YfiM (DUF2279 family)